MWAIILFAMAAVLGATLASLHFRNRGLPLPLALAHGGFAAAGLVALLYFGSVGAMGTGWLPALGLLIVAALGGFFLFAQHLRKARLPNGMVVGHALLAVTGFLLLIVSVWR